jgi:hypothetical protein
LKKFNYLINVKKIESATFVCFSDEK